VKVLLKNGAMKIVGIVWTAVKNINSSKRIGIKKIQNNTYEIKLDAEILK
jgi:hypothetical protein